MLLAPSRAQLGRRRNPRNKAEQSAPARRVLTQKIPQHRQQGNIRWRHRILRQPARASPFELLAFERSDIAVPVATEIERHQEVEVVVGVAGEGEWGDASLANLDTQFLPELPN